MIERRIPVVVAVCTYRRNDPLRRLLRSLEQVARHATPTAALGVVVVDDNSDGRARAVVEEFTDSFELGIRYERAGHGNISIARNLAIGTAAPLADWVAMTDDDCVPVPEWITELLEVQSRTGASCVTGPCVLRVPDGSPSWLTDEPFLEDGQLREDDGAPMDLGATNNSMLSASWWTAHPHVRFDERLGVVGGEDMVFYRAAVRAGLDVRFAARAVVHGEEPADRATLRHQLRSRFWLGNTQCVTNIESGEASRGRIALVGMNLLRKAVQRTVVRLVRRERPQVRYALATSLRAAGILVGVCGFRVRHH